MENYSQFLKRYRDAEPESRIEIILENYAVFPGKINIIEAEMKFNIISEQEFLRSHRRGETGIRVNNSELSNPTERAAFNNMELDDAFKEGTLDSILKGIDNASEYEEDYRTLGVMKREFLLLKTFMKNIDEEDSEIVLMRLEENKSFNEIAIAIDLHKDTVRRRYNQIRLDINNELVACLELSSKTLKPTIQKGGGQDDAG